MRFGSTSPPSLPFDGPILPDVMFHSFAEWKGSRAIHRPEPHDDLVSRRQTRFAPVRTRTEGTDSNRLSAGGTKGSLCLMPTLTRNEIVRLSPEERLALIGQL